jgi:hypothetical protein
MFMRRFRIRDGVPLFSHRFRFRFEAHLIKGSSIFLKIDESPTKITKNNRPLVLDRIYQMYKIKKQEMITALLGELMKGKSREMKSDRDSRLISRPMDAQELEVLRTVIMIPDQMDGMEMFRSSREIDKSDPGFEFRTFDPEIDTHGSVELDIPDRVKHASVYSGETVQMSLEERHLWKEKSIDILPQRMQELQEAFKVGSVTVESSGDPSIVKEESRTGDSFYDPAITLADFRAELGRFDPEAYKEDYREIRRVPAPKGIEVTLGTREIASLAARELYKTDSSREIKKNQISEIMSLSVTSTLEKGMLIEMDKSEVMATLGKGMGSGRLISTNAVRIFFKSDFERVSMLDSSRRPMTKQAVVPVHMKDAIRTALSKLQPSKEITDILSTVTLSGDQVRESKELVKRDNPSFYEKISLFEYSKNPSTIQALFNVTLRDSYTVGDNRFFTTLSRKDAFRPESGPMLNPEKRSNMFVFGGGYSIGKLGRSNTAPWVRTFSLGKASTYEIFASSGMFVSKKNERGIYVPGEAGHLSRLVAGDIWKKESLALGRFQNNGIFARKEFLGLTIDTKTGSVTGPSRFIGELGVPGEIFVGSPMFSSPMKETPITVDPSRRFVLGYGATPLFKDELSFLRHAAETEVTKGSGILLSDAALREISESRVRKALAGTETAEMAKFRYENSVNFLKLHKRWWFISPTDPKTRIELPEIDYPFEDKPVMDISSHPIPQFEGEGMEDIDVSIEVVLELVNLVMHWWHHSYSELHRGMGDETIIGLFSVLDSWYHLATSQEQIEQKEADEDYKRVFRWMRWEAEKVFFDFKNDSANNLIYNGNHYMETFTSSLLDYIEFHHYMVVPLYKSLDRMDIMRAVMGDDPQGDVMTGLPDKQMGERNYMIDEEDEGKLL